MNLEIKKFEELTTEELYEILRVRSEVFVVEQECVYNDVDGKDQKSVHIMIWEDKKILAYLRVIEAGVSYTDPSLGRVLVVKDARGRRLARRIVVEGMNYITNIWKKNRITIGAQDYLKEFYESLGFKPVSEVYLEDGIPHIDMTYEKK